MNDAAAYPASSYFLEKQPEETIIGILSPLLTLFLTGSSGSVMSGNWGNIAHRENNTNIVILNVREDAKEKSLHAQFEERAERWERESGIHSAPGATYLYKDYLNIIAMGIANKKAIIPLILKRLPTSGSDWFFALENIADENPAKDSEDFDAAFDAWCEWATQNKIIKDKNEVLRS